MSAKFYLTAEIEISKLTGEEKTNFYSLKILSKYGTVTQMITRKYPVEHIFIELKSDTGESLIEFVEQYKNVIL